MEFQFDAYVTAVLFDLHHRAIFALGDGTVRFEDGTTVQAHPDGSVQCACPHPSGEGEDGAVMLVEQRGGDVGVEVEVHIHP